MLFIVPNRLITGGFTGLVLFFNRTAGILVSIFVRFRSNVAFIIVL
ncbi:MAG: hypothetical protein KH237_14140 [Clostridium sp.]|nr:hypothetical protein [Eisenbergiella porci]MBS7032220.1 hypothetical protein [Clostridium sp.]